MNNGTSNRCFNLDSAELSIDIFADEDDIETSLALEALLNEQDNSKARESKSYNHGNRITINTHYEDGNITTGRSKDELGYPRSAYSIHSHDREKSYSTNLLLNDGKTSLEKNQTSKKCEFDCYHSHVGAVHTNYSKRAYEFYNGLNVKIEKNSHNNAEKNSNYVPNTTYSNEKGDPLYDLTNPWCENSETSRYAKV